ncbi:MAG: hypothetical protein H7249_12830 [Chitinophagaceae bacterium]|nr:hypothetical protein [Oligoflexus sp.]
MTEVYLNYPSYALGDHAVSIEDSVRDDRTITDLQAFLEAGFKQHWIAAPGTHAYDLAVRAVEPIKEHLSEVDTIVYSTCLTLNGNMGLWDDFLETRDVKHLLDYPVSHLQSHFGLQQASAIGLNQQACTSVLGSIRIARGLFLAEPSLREVLCVSADRFPEGALYEQAFNLIADGASAFVLSRKPAGFRILSTAAITNGALARANDEETVGTYFNYTWKVIQSALSNAGLTASALNWVVPQNTNMKAWQILSRILGIPFDRVYAPSLSTVGHIISSDNIVNLVALEQDERLKSGDKILLCMAGYGLNWQAVIIEKV